MDIHKYNRLTTKNLEKEILIKCRNNYIAAVSKELLEKNIISREYLNTAIRINNLKKFSNDTTPISEEQRIEYLTILLQRECRKTTSKFISEL